jgi:hypothetical protein
VVENLFRPMWSNPVTRPRPSIQYGIERNRVGFDVRVASLVKPIHPFKNFFGAFSSSTAASALGPGIQNSLKTQVHASCNKG